MLQVANTELFNPSVPKSHSSEWQKKLIPLPFKAIIGRFLFFGPSALTLYNLFII